jgi:hypothetical protein
MPGPKIGTTNRVGSKSRYTIVFARIRHLTRIAFRENIVHDKPALAVPPCLSVLPVLFCPFCSACPVLPVPSCLSCSACPIMPLPYCLSCAAFPFFLSCSAYTASPVLFWVFQLSHSGCPIPAVTVWLFRYGCLGLAFLFWLSFSDNHVLTIMAVLFCPSCLGSCNDCPVHAALSGSPVLAIVS